MDYSGLFGLVLVQSLNLGPIWQASDSLSPKAPGSARRPFLKFAPEPFGVANTHPCWQSKLDNPAIGWMSGSMFALTPRFEMAKATKAQINADLIRRAYDAFSRGDMEGAFAVFAKDILWHIPGRGPLSRDYRGHAEVQGFFQHFMELSSGTFRLQVDHILAEGDLVVVLCTDSAQRGDHSWSSPQVHVWTIRDGYAAIFRQYQGDQQTEDEFWSASV